MRTVFAGEKNLTELMKLSKNFCLPFYYIICGHQSHLNLIQRATESILKALIDFIHIDGTNVQVNQLALLMHAASEMIPAVKE